MAAIKVNYYRYCPGFSLFESVAAIAVISVMIGIGTTVFSNVVKSEKPIQHYLAQNEIENHFYQLKQKQEFISKTFSYDTYEIEQKVDFHNGNKRLFVVEYNVVSQGKKWYTQKHLVKNPYAE